MLEEYLGSNTRLMTILVRIEDYRRSCPEVVIPSTGCNDQRCNSIYGYLPVRKLQKGFHQKRSSRI
jgi:hypothetical protein